VVKCAEAARYATSAVVRSSATAAPAPTTRPVPDIAYRVRARRSAPLVLVATRAAATATAPALHTNARAMETLATARKTPTTTVITMSQLAPSRHALASRQDRPALIAFTRTCASSLTAIPTIAKGSRPLRAQIARVALAVAHAEVIRH